MSRDETARELDKLRAEVSALSDARRETSGKSAEPQEATAEESVAVETSASDVESVEAQKSQLEELGDLLQAEIRDLPTITCLTVFTLGILMGRLLR